MCAFFFFFFSNFIVPTTEEFHRDGIENQKVLFFFPVSYTVLCEHSVFSASYLYASLPVTRRPQQGPEASGWPRSAVAACQQGALHLGLARPPACGRLEEGYLAGAGQDPLPSLWCPLSVQRQEDVHQVTAPFLNPDSREYPSKPCLSTSANILVRCMQGLWK